MESRQIEVEEGPNEGAYIVGGLLAYNIAFRDSLVSKVNKLAFPMMLSTKRKIGALFSDYDKGRITLAQLVNRSQMTLLELSETQAAIFENGASEISKLYTEGQIKSSRASVRKAVKPLNLPGHKFVDDSEDFNAMQKMAFIAMFAYVVNVQKFYHEKISFEVNTAVRAGSSSGVMEYIEKQQGITERYIKNKLGDNYRQDFNALSRQLLVRNNSDYFLWVHTDRAEKARIYHKNGLNGGVFRIDRPPVIDQSTGETGYPGEAFGCQCIMQALRKMD